MKINDDHLYHGAALTQIAEHPNFTAINAFLEDGKISRSSFLVNNGISVYLKYAKEPTKRKVKEYIFSFNKEYLEEIDRIYQKAENTFVALVCVSDRQICCLSRDELFEMIKERKDAKKSEGQTFTVLVTVPNNKSLRVYMNAPRKKNNKLTPRVIPRKRFPNAIFDEAKDNEQ